MTGRNNQVLRTAAYVFAYALGALVLVGVLAAVAQTRDLVGAVRESQKTNTGTIDLIRDCTEPDGECYRDGQKRTASAVGDINRVIVLAAACAVGVSPGLPVVDRQSRIQACVIDRLAANP